MRIAVLLLSFTCLLPALAFDDQDVATRSHAEALWKTNVRKQQGKISHSQTEHALVLGTADAKLLENIGKAAERSIVFAQKSVGYDKEAVKRENQQMTDRPYQWEGKLIVLVCKERHEFVDLFAKLKQAKPDANEVCMYGHDKSRSYVLLGPAGTARKVNYEVLAVEQAGAVTLTRRHDPIPRWLATGYGRMLAYKFDSKGFASERSKIPVWAAQHHVRELMTNENQAIAPAMLLPLQASLVECLAQSPTFADQWFKLLDETAYRGGNMDSAFNELKITHEMVQIAWKNSLWK